MSHETSLHPTVASSVITLQRGADQSTDSYHIHSASPADGAFLAARALKASAAHAHSVNDTMEDGSGVQEGYGDRSPGRRATAFKRYEENATRKPATSSPSASPRIPGSGSGSGSGSPRAPQHERSPRFRRPVPGDRLSEYSAGRVDGSHRRPGSSHSGHRSRGATPTLGSGAIPQHELGSSSHSSRAKAKSPFTSPQGTPSGAVNGSDYFGLGIAVTKDQPKTGDAQATNRASYYTTRRANFAPHESPTSDARAKIRATKEKRERDKKSMLSKALEKANTAVLLDNAQNFAAALDAYHDACLLLAQVMERTSGAEDRAKLDAIRVTYSNRMDELTIMQSLDAEEGQEKELPPRPESEGSDEFPTQTDAVAAAEAETSAAATSTVPPGRTRDSFLTGAIREVEGGSSGGFLGPLWERSKTPLGALHETGRPDADLRGPDAPAPLRTPSPQPPAKTDEAGEPVSWLNTIDESDSDGASVHSGKGGSDLRRRNLNKGIAKGPTALNTAFDEAVEAAYQDGYQPNHGDQTQDMLADIAQDYLDQDTFFNPTSLSSLPQDSGSNPNAQKSAQTNAQAGGRDEVLLPQTRFDPKASTSGPAGRRPSTMSAKAPSIAPSIASHSARKGRQASVQRSLDVAPWEATDKAEVTPWETHALSSEVTPWETQSLAPSRPGLAPSIAPSVASSTTSALKDRRNRLSNGSLKPLTIDTPSYVSGRVKRTTSVSSKKTIGSQRGPEVTPWETADSRPEVTPWETQSSATSDVTPWESQSGPSGDVRIQKIPSSKKHDGSQPLSALSDSGSSALTDLASPKSRSLRGNQSSLSLREQSIVEHETPVPTPHTSTSYPSTRPRHDSTSQHSQKSFTLTSAGTLPPLPADGGQHGGLYLFDTTLGRSVDQIASSSPRTPKDSSAVAPFEPCPDSNLLRPFWLLRSISNTIISTRGAYITTRLFMPHDAWLNKTAKLRNVEDKILACDTLTSALVGLENVDHNDADAVLEELQKFEEAMERVQTTLAKRLGSEVGVNNSIIKEADKAADTTTDGQLRNSKFSWKKLSGKQSVANPPSAGATNNRGSGENATMSTVPMTSFMGTDKKNLQRKQALQDATIGGPHKSYMEAVARLGVAAQVIDQIARQVEDPGLKHTSTTHVGLELSTRHAAEFFGFYICRFLLADVGLLIDKYVKRSTEWVLS